LAVHQRALACGRRWATCGRAASLHNMALQLLALGRTEEALARAAKA
jgi:hypothetical protein